MHDRLTELAIINGTDKFGMHDYTPNYYDILKGLEQSNFNFLEIGVGGYGQKNQGGYSLKMWRDFFQNAEITGFDIHHKELELGERIEVACGSQVDPEFLKELREKRGPFQVILDDGSHINEHVVQSFDILYPHLLPEGFYIAEDLQTAFYPARGGSLEGTQPNSVFYFADIQQDLQNRPDILNVRRFHNIVSFEKPSAQHVADLQSDLCHLMRRFKGQNLRVLMVDPTPEYTKAVDQAAFDNQISLSGHSTSSQKAKDVIANGQYNLVIVAGTAEQDTEILNASLMNLNDGAMWIYLDPNDQKSPDLSTYLHRLFVNIDHTEIRINFPDSDTLAVAPRAYEMSTYHNLTNIVVGPNNFPSNANYTGDSEIVQAYVQRSKDIVDQVTDGYALFQLEVWYKKTGNPDLSAKMVHQSDISDVFSPSQIVAKIRDDSGRYTNEQKFSLIERSLKSYPKSVGIMITFGQFYRSLNQFENAIEVFQQALELQPENKTTQSLLAQSYIQLGNLEKAEELSRSLQESFPEDIISYLALERLYKASEGAIDVLPIFEAKEALPANNEQFTALRNRIEALSIKFKKAT